MRDWLLCGGGLLIWVGVLADASYAVLMQSWGCRYTSWLSQLVSWLLG